jgi:hypothetical protein
VKKTGSAKAGSSAEGAAKAGAAGKRRGGSGTKARAATAPRSFAAPIELPDGMWERIAKKAYELYEARGRGEGQDLADWLKAEEMVMEEIHEARE